MLGIVNSIACRHCQAHLDAYLDRQLTPKARRRVGQHIARCETCYAEYVRRRDLRDELKRTLPLVGQHSAPNFARTWQAVRRDLPHPTYERRRDQARFGLAALMVMLILLLPFTMRHRDLPLILPPRPAPDVSQQGSTPAQTEPVAFATVAASVTQGHESKAATQLPTVPEPHAIRGTNGN